ncbi:MAG: RluA family pseudouridine synthase [Candidatus Binatia bacterium]
MADQAIKVATKTWTLPAERREIRLDAFVRQCLPHLSRREIENAIRAKLFFVGDKASKKGDRLGSGDELVFHGPASWLTANPLPESALEVPIVYEDASILLVNKPAGMPTHGFSARDSGTLANFLLARRPALVNIGTSRWEPGLVHRIDRETSGLVLVAKTETAFADLKSQFRRRRVKKIYWALVWGITRGEGVIELPLAHDSGGRARMRAVTRRAHARGRTWNALTRYRKLGQSRGLSLLEIDMETGVTHQIRAHLAAIGHPIVADAVYGAGRSENLGLKRHFLHARSLAIFHPDGDGLLTVEADLPKELGEILSRLKIKL